MTTTPEQPTELPTELPADIPAVTLPGDLEAAPAPLPQLPSSGRGLTLGGWPYVTDDAHPLQYPIVSQQLAEKLDAGTVTLAGAGTYAVDGSGATTIPLGDAGLVEGRRTAVYVAVNRGFQAWATANGYGPLLAFAEVSPNQREIGVTIVPASGPPAVNLNVGLDWIAVRTW